MAGRLGERKHLSGHFGALPHGVGNRFGLDFVEAGLAQSPRRFQGADRHRFRPALPMTTRSRANTLSDTASFRPASTRRGLNVTIRAAIDTARVPTRRFHRGTVFRRERT
jgi:hypothetical protein